MNFTREKVFGSFEKRAPGISKKTRKWRFQKIPLWRAVLRSRVFGDRFNQIPVDGRRKTERETKGRKIKKTSRFEMKTDARGTWPDIYFLHASDFR